MRDFNLFVSRDYVSKTTGKAETNWVKIGGASWQSKDSKKLTLFLDVFPIQDFVDKARYGRPEIVMAFPVEEKDENSKPTESALFEGGNDVSPI